MRPVWQRALGAILTLNFRTSDGDSNLSDRLESSGCETRNLGESLQRRRPKTGGHALRLGDGVGAFLVPCLRMSPELQRKTFWARESRRFEGRVSGRSGFGLKVQSAWKWFWLESNHIRLLCLQLIAFHFPQLIHTYIPFMSWQRNGHAGIILYQVIHLILRSTMVHNSWVLLASNYEHGGLAHVLFSFPKVPLRSIGIIYSVEGGYGWPQPEAGLFRSPPLFFDEMLRTRLSLIAIKPFINPKFPKDGEGGVYRFLQIQMHNYFTRIHTLFPC